MAENPKTHNEAGEVAPSTVDQQAPSVSEENSPSTNEAVATDIPTANAPDSETNLVANQEESREKGTAVVTSPDESTLHAPAEEKPAAKKAASPPKAGKPEPSKAAVDKTEAGVKAAKKEKPPKAPAVEDKPFVEFMEQDYLPALQKAIAKQGVEGLDLAFAKQKVPVTGFNEECWQVVGRWENGLRQFNLYFPDEDIQGKRAFSCNEGRKPSTIEPFLIDERKITLDLMVFGVLQRLNGQKWLALN